MKRVILLAAVLALCSTLALAGAYLENDTGQTAFTLQVTFSEPVTITGFGDALVLVDPVEQAAQFTFSGGEVPPLSGEWLNWEPVSARIVAHKWGRPLDAASAVASLVSHGPIAIRSDSEFLHADSGVTGGTGTADDPYIIEGWSIQGGGTGIFIEHTSKCFVVRNCSLRGNVNGILIAYARNGVVDHCSVSHTTTPCPIEVQDEFNNCGDGISVFQSTGITVRGCELKNIYWSGISIYGSNECEVTLNVVVDCGGQGIEISRASNNNVVSDNLITESGGGIYYGLCITCDSCGNQVLRNIFRGNTPGAIRVDSSCRDGCINVVDDNVT